MTNSVKLDLSDLTAVDRVALASVLGRAGGRRDLSRRVGAVLDTAACAVADAARAVQTQDSSAPKGTATDA